MSRSRLPDPPAPQRKYIVKLERENAELREALRELREAAAWRDTCWTIHAVVAKKWEVGSDEDLRFIALALSGEMGELNNLIKKAWRGDFHLKEKWTEVSDEIADVRIYLELLTRILGLDLDACCQRKTRTLLKRWPEAREAVAAKKNPTHEA